jgi:hypothetical protein
MPSWCLKFTPAAVLVSALTVGCATPAPEQPQPIAVPQTLMSTPLPVSLTTPTQFGSAVTQGWDAASGYSYELAGQPEEFCVGNGQASMRASYPGETLGMLVSNYAARDVDVTARMRSDRPSSGGDQYLYLLARTVGSSTGYAARLRVDPVGAAWLQAVRTRDGVDELLGSEVRLDSGDASLVKGFWIRLQVSDVNPTSIQIKAWPEARPEPDSWQYSTLDDQDLREPGAVGVRTYLSKRADNPPVSIAVAGFRAETVSPTSRPEVAGVSAIPTAVMQAGATISESARTAPTPVATTASGADSPVATVAQFYALVGRKQLSQALELWTPHMRVSFPPAENLDDRFKYTDQIQVERAQLASFDNESGRATVEVTLHEVLELAPFERRYIGTWQVVRDNGTWMLDQPNLTVVQ